MAKEKISITAAAELIASLLLTGAWGDSEVIVKEIEESQKLKPSETRLGNVRVEMLHFYLNLVDRLAFKYLEEKRVDFFDRILATVFKDFFKGHKSSGGQVNEQIFYKIFNETHKKRQEEYGQYKFTTEKESGSKGSLFWEFESRLAEILGTKDDSLVIWDINSILMPSVEKFHEVCKKFMKEVI
ncbi:MAG: hypothetical protein HOJ15_02565 [Candidatus Jacksonbacteria bacterium]|nr:hypothetical protein [Candidatus Jacksonbacteria bacterium]